MTTVRALAAAAVLLLGGCAHFAPKPGWHCAARIEDGSLTASTVRTLTRDGRQLRVRSHWLRGYELTPRSLFRGDWTGAGLEPDFAGGWIAMELSVPGGGLYDLELRRGSPDAAVIDKRLREEGKSTSPALLAVPWPLMQELLAAGAPLFLVAVTRDGARLAVERLDPRMFEAGRRAVATTLDRSRSMLADFPSRCQEHQEIILT